MAGRPSLVRHAARLQHEHGDDRRRRVARRSLVRRRRRRAGRPTMAPIVAFGAIVFFVLLAGLLRIAAASMFTYSSRTVSRFPSEPSPWELRRRVVGRRARRALGRPDSRRRPTRRRSPGDRARRHAAGRSRYQPIPPRTASATKPIASGPSDAADRRDDGLAKHVAQPEVGRDEQGVAGREPDEEGAPAGRRGRWPRWHDLDPGVDRATATDRAPPRRRRSAWPSTGP